MPAAGAELASSSLATTALHLVSGSEASYLSRRLEEMRRVVGV